MEDFHPQNPSEVTMYICGPTVYNLFHIGNARTFIMADIIRRYLVYKGYKVKFVMNITDVDDKIINKAKQEKITADEVAAKYSQEFFADLDNLKIEKAAVYPKATEHIDVIINMIKKLVESDYAYNVDGNVFYDIAKFKSYGKLSGKKIDELESGARIEVNEEKNNPLDFAVWKKAKEGEPYWESPWGKGRPGWHIECSAMSCKHLGETFDIHAGGNDLIFPHHENEIAQSEAANGKTFARYWIHFGFLNINKEKMSKSLGNFFTARDVLQKFSAEAIRLFFAQAHYHGPLDFSDELLESAAKGLEKLENLQEVIQFNLSKNNLNGLEPDFDFNEFEQRFTGAMDDDFNTPQAVAVIFDFIKEANKIIASHQPKVDFYREINNFLDKTAGKVLGITNTDINDTGNALLENSLIELLIDIRLNAKKEKNFTLSDSIREKLGEIGVVLKDTKEGTSYTKKNKY